MIVVIIEHKEGGSNSNTKIMFSSETDLWATPQQFFDELNKEFNFTLDPCATHENAKCAKYYTIQEDGLKQDWQQECVFCNPPYGRAIKKLGKEMLRGKSKA